MKEETNVQSHGSPFLTRLRHGRRRIKLILGPQLQIRVMKKRTKRLNQAGNTRNNPDEDEPRSDKEDLDGRDSEGEDDDDEDLEEEKEEEQKEEDDDKADDEDVGEEQLAVEENENTIW
ncbi:nucleoplasmin-like protein ANO39 [Microplitis demolitor]|uniref:nucleoplasmin-like protein ANO39 n=1 Tax=Microplitis demolitor TaxID=69319 RepID=UPI00235B6459|nr:nucleoplasmin-like protein ANO39 [Microplitis demolitor]